MHLQDDGKGLTLSLIKESTIQPIGLKRQCSRSPKLGSRNLEPQWLCHFSGLPPRSTYSRSAKAIYPHFASEPQGAFCRSEYPLRITPSLDRRRAVYDSLC